MSEHLTPASPAMRRTWSCDSRGPVRMEQQRAAAVALQVWWQLAPLAPRNHCALPCMRGGREWGSGRDRVTSQAGKIRSRASARPITASPERQNMSARAPVFSCSQ